MKNLNIFLGVLTSLYSQYNNNNNNKSLLLVTMLHNLQTTKLMLICIKGNKHIIETQSKNVKRSITSFYPYRTISLQQYPCYSYAATQTPQSPLKTNKCKLSQQRQIPTAIFTSNKLTKNKTFHVCPNTMRE